MSHVGLLQTTKIEPLPSPPDGLRGLVVDDNPTNLFIVGLFLRKLGVGHDNVPHGADAILAVEAFPYDFVLMDIEMPVLDGYATTRAIREREQARGVERTPIVALSADILQSTRIRASEAGMDDFVTKPVTLDALRLSLATLLDARQSTRSIRYR